MFITEILLLCLFKQASACQPPTREICCIGPGIVDSWEKELYIMLDIMYIYIYIYIYLNIFMYILKAYMKTTWCWHPLPLHAWSAPREVNPNFSGNWAPISRTRGWKSSPDFRQNPSAGNRCPIWAARGGNRALQPFGCKLVRLQLGQIQVASTAIHLHLLHGHRPRPRPDQIQNPNSKRPVWILDFGFRILDFGFWILDFGFWILDFGFWISDFGFRILDFGFWILDFGFWILDFGSV